MICAASSAAFFAPSMATVATGMPGGICTVDKSASSPSSVEDLTGTPMTGSVVLAAMAPARCAALPAAAMMAPKPSARAFSAKARASSGVRCAESTRTQNGTPSALSVSAQGRMTFRSLSLPMTTATLRKVIPPVYEHWS